MVGQRHSVCHVDMSWTSIVVVVAAQEDVVAAGRMVLHSIGHDNGTGHLTVGQVGHRWRMHSVYCRRGGCGVAAAAHRRRWVRTKWEIIPGWSAVHAAAAADVVVVPMGRGIGCRRGCWRFAEAKVVSCVAGGPRGE